MNVLIIVGEIANDPVVAFSAKGDAYCHLRIKDTEHGHDGKEYVTWHSVTLWRREAEEIGAQWQRGDIVEIRATLSYRKSAQAEVYLPNIRVQKAERLIAAGNLVTRTSEPSAESDADTPPF